MPTVAGIPRTVWFPSEINPIGSNWREAGVMATKRTLGGINPSLRSGWDGLRRQTGRLHAGLQVMSRPVEMLVQPGHSDETRWCAANVKKLT